METFRNSRKYNNVRDMAAAEAIMLFDKQEKHDPAVNPVELINTALKVYTKINEELAKHNGYNRPFDPNDAGMSVYNLSFQRATNNALQAGTNPGEKTTAFIRHLGSCVSELKRCDQLGGEEYKPVVGRMIGDLSTLAAFAHTYSADFETAISAAPDKVSAYQAVRDLYVNKRALPRQPSIFNKRLRRVLVT